MSPLLVNTAPFAAFFLTLIAITASFHTATGIVVRIARLEPSDRLRSEAGRPNLDSHAIRLGRRKPANSLLHQSKPAKKLPCESAAPLAETLSFTAVLSTRDPLLVSYITLKTRQINPEEKRHRTLKIH